MDGDSGKAVNRRRQQRREARRRREAPIKVVDAREGGAASEPVGAWVPGTSLFWEKARVRLLAAMSAKGGRRVLPGADCVVLEKRPDGSALLCVQPTQEKVVVRALQAAVWLPQEEELDEGDDEWGRDLESCLGSFEC
eukprot:TRINITY_DN1259_c1_g1_i1.p2 TRINITY_DN1259_c1_g1~~TRINITY_DN1259_c1_g1_i1.p2  ORF type:complete len:138 (+),score=53.29 TRINITY_DN1259_c1_g1_i1:67-480(+)